MDECVVVAVGVPRFLEESSVASAVSVRIILSSSSCPVACASRMSRRAGDDFWRCPSRSRSKSAVPWTWGRSCRTNLSATVLLVTWRRRATVSTAIRRSSLIGTNVPRHGVTEPRERPPVSPQFV